MTTATPPSTVTLTPGVPVTLTPQAVGGVSFASFENDNTVAGGLNAVATSVSVHLTWEATQDGINWYPIASCSVAGGGGASVTPGSGFSIGVSTMPSEQQVRVTAVQPSAVAGSVTLAPTVSAAAVTA